MQIKALVAGFTALGIALVALSSNSSAEELPVAESSAPPASIPLLTATDRAAATTAEHSDAHMVSLNQAAASVSPKTSGRLASARTRINSSGPGQLPVIEEEGVWHVGSQKVGVVRQYMYLVPFNVSARSWPLLRYIPGETGYRKEFARFSIVGLRRLTVVTDVSTGQVVSMEPLDYTSIDGIDLTSVDTTVREGPE